MKCELCTCALISCVLNTCIAVKLVLCTYESGSSASCYREADGQSKPVEIVGVQDITQQIAVQMEGQQQGGRDTVIQVDKQVLPAISMTGCSYEVYTG